MTLGSTSSIQLFQVCNSKHKTKRLLRTYTSALKARSGPDASSSYVFIIYVAGGVANVNVGTLNVVEPSPAPHVVPILANKSA